MKKLAWVLALATVMAGCASMDVYKDYDRHADFSSYKTYSWRELPRGPASEPATPTARRVHEAIDKGLRGRGLQPAATGQPDLYVVASGGSARKTEVVTSPAGPVYGRYPYGYYGQTVDAHDYIEGNLVVDLIDARTNKMVWRGVATETLDKRPADQETINEAVTKILAQYPPQQGD